MALQPYASRYVIFRVTRVDVACMHRSPWRDDARSIRPSPLALFPQRHSHVLIPLSSTLVGAIRKCPRGVIDCPWADGGWGLVGRSLDAEHVALWQGAASIMRPGSDTHG